MRILVVADIHANWPALEAIDEPHDFCICLGDLVDYGVDPVPCIQWVRDHCQHVIRGNHDHAVAQNIVASGEIGYRMLALIRKEFRQILRDRRLAISLILPPTLQLLLFGFALNATVSNLHMGVVDDSRTPESRELIATMTESNSCHGAGT